MTPQPDDASTWLRRQWRKRRRACPGFVDFASADLIAGWANGLNDSRETEITVGSMLRDRVTAEQTRADLDAAGYGDARAFHFQIPRAAYPDINEVLPTSVQVRHAASNQHLVGSPAYVFDIHHTVRQLNVFSMLFFDAHGREFLHGGSERYIIDLANLAEAAYGIGTTVYQASSNGFWTQAYGKVAVRGVPWNGTSLSDLSFELHRHSERGVLNIYSPFILAAKSCHRPAIGISHGVFWDVPGHGFQQGENEEVVLSGLLHCEETVSVDTNTINFVRAIRSDLAEKMSYVPNYVDAEFRGDSLGAFPRRHRLTVGFPRRLYDPRGFALLEQVIPEVLGSYPDVCFKLIGGIASEDRPRLDRMLEAFPERVAWEQHQPADMPRVYPTLDIALIPTVHSEGTSLSALEAMAAGCCVIATNVGGLPDIVIDGYNGLLIEPNAVALKESLVRLIDDPQLRSALSERGREVASSFSKEKWNASWKSRIDERLLSTPGLSSHHVGAVPVVHLRTPGISWSTMKQRPHHVCRALAAQGVHTYFISDTTESAEAVADAADLGINLIQPDMELHLDNAVLYYYYAYFTGELVARFKDGDASKAASASYTGGNLLLDKALLWFDVLDHPDIHEDRAYGDHFAQSISSADILTYSSGPLREVLGSRAHDAAPIFNGVFPDDFRDVLVSDALLTRSGLQAIESRFGLTLSRVRSARTVLFYGAVADWVDLDLLDSLASRGDVVLLVAGPVVNSRREEAQALFARPNVEHLGVVPYEDLPLLAACADVGVVPFDLRLSRLVHSVLPLKLLEFLAAGLPVICTRLAAIEDALIDAPSAVLDRVLWADELDAAWPRRLGTRPPPDADYVKWLKSCDWKTRVSHLPLIQSSGRRRMSVADHSPQCHVRQNSDPRALGVALDGALCVVSDWWAQLRVDRANPAEDVRILIRATGAGSTCGDEAKVVLDTGQCSFNFPLLGLMREAQSFVWHASTDQARLALCTQTPGGHGSVSLNIEATAVGARHDP